MERVETPEYCFPHRCHNKAFATCIGVDAEWKSERISQQESGCRSDWPGEFFPPEHRFTDSTFLPKLSDVAEGLAYLHARHTTHGDLKGVIAFPGLRCDVLITF